MSVSEIGKLNPDQNGGAGDKYNIVHALTTMDFGCQSMVEET